MCPASVFASSADKRQAVSKQVPGTGLQQHDVLLLKQRSNRLGFSELYIYSDGAKFLTRNGSLIAVCKAPDWHLVFFNKDRNLGYTCSYESMTKQTLDVFGGPPFSKGKVRHSYDKSFGFHTEVIIIDGKLEPQGSNDPFIFQAREKKKFASLCYVGADSIPLNTHVQSYLRWLYNLGNHQGIPLSFRKSFTDGSSENDYETVSVSRCQRPSAFFSYPTGFKSVSKIVEVEMVEDPRSTLEDLFGSKH